MRLIEFFYQVLWILGEGSTFISALSLEDKVKLQFFLAKIIDSAALHNQEIEPDHLSLSGVINLFYPQILEFKGQFKLLEAINYRKASYVMGISYEGIENRRYSESNFDFT